VTEYISKLTMLDGFDDAECWVLRSIGDRMNALHSLKCLSRASRLIVEDPESSRMRLVVPLNEQALTVAFSNQGNLEFPGRGMMEADRVFLDLLHAVFLHNSGVNSYNSGNYTGASEIFETSIRTGCVFDSLIGLACSTYKNMEYAKSAYIIRLLLEKQPPSPETILLSRLLGIAHTIHHTLLDYEAQSLLRTQDGNNLFSAVLANVGEGCSLDLQCVRDALICYQDAIAIAPNNLIALHNAAVALKCIGADEDSKRIFDVIISRNEDNPLHHSALLHLGEIYSGQQRPLLACQYLDKATHVKSGSLDVDEAWYTASRLAESHIYASRLSDARSIISKFSAESIGSSNSQNVEIALLALDVMIIAEGLQSVSLETAPRSIPTDILMQTLDSLKKSSGWEECSVEVKRSAYDCECLINRLSHVN